jgi:uncharacterized Zn finger protein
MSWFQYRPYVSVAERRRNAQREAAKLGKQGKTLRPVQIEGRTIARTFWGKAWCDNLESYMDYENRLPRGRTYVRNGSVVHLDIRAGEIEALVSGSSLYKVRIQITPAAQPKWKKLCRECTGGIGSLVELLQGRFSDLVMSILTRRDTGLFPSPAEIQLKCSCPDWATLCKHVAAVLYGVGARLDQSPELLFLLRSVNHEELITQAATATHLSTQAATAGSELDESEISGVFGIELDTQPVPPPASAKVSSPAATAVSTSSPAKPKRPAKLKLKPTRARKPKTASSTRITSSARKRLSTLAKARWRRIKQLDSSSPTAKKAARPVSS